MVITNKLILQRNTVFTRGNCNTTQKKFDPELRAAVFRTLNRISSVLRVQRRRLPAKPRCRCKGNINPLKPELNPICYFLALLGAHHFLHVSRIRVKLLTLR